MSPLFSRPIFVTNRASPCLNFSPLQVQFRLKINKANMESAKSSKVGVLTFRFYFDSLFFDSFFFPCPEFDI